MTWRRVTPIPIKRRAKHTKSGHTYTDEKTRDDLKRVADSYDGEMLDGALSLQIIICSPLPKSKRKREQFTCKPDVDNVAKCVMDGLQGKAYKNDSQIVQLYVAKMPRDGVFNCPYVEYKIGRIGYE